MRHVLKKNGQEANEMKLENLCKYYISCIALESSATIRVSLKDQKSFCELPWVSNKILQDVGIASFLRGNFDKEKDLMIGYPILKAKNFLSPVFVLHISYSDGSNNRPEGFYIDNDLLINKDIIDKYSTNDKTENIYELRDLESQLGFTDGHASFFDIQEKITLLQSIRNNWEWVETMDFANLRKGKISETVSDGIINNAILIAKDPTPYTVGLSNELIQLTGLKENSLSHSILWKFLHKKINQPKPFKGEILEVLPLNEEQKEAVKSALTADITLIAGPPGTGKTQVVANLIINAAIQGQRVLFTSKNNNAVDVVVKRVNGLNKRLPLILRYEKNTHQCISDYVLQWENHKAKKSTLPINPFDAYKNVYDSYRAKIEQKRQIVDARNKLDELEQVVCPLRTKYADLIGNLSDHEINKVAEAYTEFVECRKSLISGPKGLKEKLFRVKWERNNHERIEATQKVVNTFMEQHQPGLSIDAGMSEREWQHFDTVFKTLINDLTLIADYNFQLIKLRDSSSLEQLDAALMTEHVELQAKAKIAWNYWLEQHSRLFTADNRAKLHDYLSLIQNSSVDDYSPRLNPLLPVSAITALSARRRLPFIDSIYDLLIIDEASQCDIASMIPLMMRAKRIAVIGDKKQLNHICILNKQIDLSLIKSYDIEPRWSYRGSSIYDLAESIAEADNIIQLRDHHRSFMDIIQFSNQEFYDNTLRIATDYSRLVSPNNGKPILGMQWMNVKGYAIRPETGGAYNIQEAEGVIRILKRLAIELNFEGTIGVTTPFHLQAELISRTLERDDELRNHLELHNKILIDTVHKFQGDERDVIIFSPVVAQGAKQQSLMFLKSTGNLFNVAITRARALLVTVGDKEFCKRCGVSYLEHFAEYSGGEQAPVESSEWEHLLQQALSDAGIPVTAQYHVDKYYLDLALFHNGRKLDIEVDGEMYHKTWTGELCYNDQLRNQALMRQGWDIQRFWVQQVRDQLPWCIHQIKKWMNQTNN